MDLFWSIASWLLKKKVVSCFQVTFGSVLSKMIEIHKIIYFSVILIFRTFQNHPNEFSYIRVFRISVYFVYPCISYISVLWAYGVVVIMRDFHRSYRGSNPGRGNELSNVWKPYAMWWIIGKMETVGKTIGGITVRQTICRLELDIPSRGVL